MQRKGKTMATIEERAEQYNRTHPFYINVDKGITIACRMFDAYIAGATEQDSIARQEEREKYIRVIRKLVDTLQTSKNYHLGITGLDSPQEIEKKQREHETALIRNINSALEYGRKAMEGGQDEGK